MSNELVTTEKQSYALTQATCHQLVTNLSPVIGDKLKWHKM